MTPRPTAGHLIGEHLSAGHLIGRRLAADHPGADHLGGGAATVAAGPPATVLSPAVTWSAMSRAGSLRPAGRGWLRRLSASCAAHPVLLTSCLVAAALGTGLTGVTPLLIRRAIDDAVAHRVTDLPVVMAGLAGLAVGTFVLTFVRRFTAGRLALDVQFDLRNRVFGSLQRLDGVRQDELRVGQVVSRTINDLQLTQGLLQVAPLALGNLALLVVAVVAMFSLSPPLAAVALAVAPLAGVTAARSRRRLLPATWLASQRAADVAEQVEQDVTGVRVVKGFGQEAREVDRMEDACRHLYADRMLAARINARFAPALQALPQVGQVAVLGLGGWLALRGSLSIGSFVAFATYLASLASVARLLSVVVVTSQLARASVERVFELIDTSPVVRDPVDAAQLPEGPVEVVFEGLVAGYGPPPSDTGRSPAGADAVEPVLRGVDLRVAAGETVAVVGPSGSGKTTLGLLLARFYDPLSGAVRVGGVDVRDVGLQALRSTVAVVFDEAFLFSDTIAANLAYGRPGATPGPRRTRRGRNGRPSPRPARNPRHHHRPRRGGGPRP